MKIYLAGVEQEIGDSALKKDLFTNVLATYYHLRSKPKERIAFIKKHTTEIVIDSGAFSFFHSKKEDKSKQGLEIYFTQYRQWLNDNREFYDWFVELDVGEIVGQDTVRRWREAFEADGLLDKCIFVYHPMCMSFDMFKEDCDNSKSRFVAVEGNRIGRGQLPYKDIVKVAYDKGVRMHGFALVHDEILRNVPFYSVDSSSWTSGTRWGSTQYHDGTKLRRVEVKKTGKSKSIYEIVGKVVDARHLYHEIPDVQRTKRFEVAIKAYKDAEKYFTELWEQRGIDWNSYDYQLRQEQNQGS